MSRGLSIIIPSRTATNLVACIEAIRMMAENSQIIVVDDFEGDRIPARVAVDAIRAEPLLWRTGTKPFVFARNMNLGIEAAGHNDVVLLNDDAELQTPEGFRVMQDILAKHPEAGILAASCNHVGNVAQHRNNARPQEFRTDPRMVCFVCVLIPRRTIDAVGLLDERFVGYGMDDDDYCRRVLEAGQTIGITDDVYVEHGRLTSTYRGRPGAGGDFRPNLRLFIEKWGVDNRGQGKETSMFPECFA